MDSQPTAATPTDPAPDDHRKFSLGEDWTATIVGLILFGLCMGGVVTAEMIP
ncbi:hypothetical protein [Brevibacterium senegalense]|uniref:hypothetical protein n=1 Tax=Brevibacterium senegalense TaxID=1033736 RepID=UPI0002F5C893|nr:hypothetical protein [Brevibacterium senegalense]